MLMKTNYFKTSIFVILSLFLYSCTETATISNLSPKKFIRINPNSCNDCSSARDFINENPELFPSNVLVFDSIGEAINLLNTLAESDYLTLKDFLEYYQIHNDIIESRIFYDSLITNFCESFSLCQDDLSTILDMCTENDINSLMNTIISNRPLLIEPINMDSFSLLAAANSFNLDDLESDSLFEIVLPTFDIYALFNEDNIVCIDNIIYKKLSDDCVICCSPENYVYIREHNDLQTIQDDVNINNEDSIFNVVIPSYYYNADRKITRESYGWSSSATYKLKMTLEYNTFFHWLFTGTSTLTKKLKIENYKRTFALFLPTPFPTIGSVRYKIEFTVDNPYGSFADEENLCEILTIPIDDNFGVKEYKYHSNCPIGFFIDQIRNRQFGIIEADIDNDRAHLIIRDNVQIQ